MSYNTQLTLRAEPKDTVAIVNLEFETNMHYVLYSSPQLDSVHCKRGILLVNTQRSTTFCLYMIIPTCYIEMGVK